VRGEKNQETEVYSNKDEEMLLEGEVNYGEGDVRFLKSFDFMDLMITLYR